MDPEIMDNRKLCENLAARLKHAEGMAKDYEDGLQDPDLPPVDRRRLEGMLIFWKNEAALIKVQLDLHCK